MDFIEDYINEYRYSRDNILYDDIPTHMSEGFNNFIDEHNLFNNGVNCKICYIDITKEIGYVKILNKSKFIKLLKMYNDDNYIDDPSTFVYENYDKISNNLQYMKIGRFLRNYTNLNNKDIEKMSLLYKDFQKQYYNFSNQ
jgi:hypothetical protein